MLVSAIIRREHIQLGRICEASMTEHIVKSERGGMKSIDCLRLIVWVCDDYQSVDVQGDGAEVRVFCALQTLQLGFQHRIDRHVLLKREVID
jgi:hypothetical protein